VEAVKFLWRQKRNTLKKEAGSKCELGSIWLFEEPEAEAFFIKPGAAMWKRKLEAEAVKAVKFLWKQNHFEKRSWKHKQTRKRLTLFGAASGNKKIFYCFHIPEWNIVGDYYALYVLNSWSFVLRLYGLVLKLFDVHVLNLHSITTNT